MVFSTIRSICPIFWEGILNWIVGDPTVGISGGQWSDLKKKVYGPYGHPLGITKSMKILEKYTWIYTVVAIDIHNLAGGLEHLDYFPIIYGNNPSY